MQRLWIGTPLLLLIAVLGAVSLRCSDDHPAEVPTPPPSAAARERTEAAIRDAASFLANPSHIYGHAGYYFVYFLHRRFGVERFRDFPDRYRSFRSRRPRPATGVDLFERLIDPTARLDRERLAAVPHPVDRFTIAALYCDQVPVPDGYADLLRRMTAAGGYELTHVALALGWLAENRCDPPLAELRPQVATAIAALVRNDGRFDDVEIEAAAMLYYLDRGDLVPGDFPASLLTAQNEDGGWAEQWPPVAGKGSNWHPTVFALWVLLESEGRGNGAPMIPPTASRAAPGNP